ncbi:unnamed protein product [Prunus armeniaca]
MEVAQWFILNNCDEIMAYLDEHEEMMKQEHPSHLYTKKHRDLFPQWFLEYKRLESCSQMDQRNMYAIPELDPTDNDVDNVTDQRLESSMETDAETLRDTNVIQEPFQLQGVSSIEIPIQSITIDLGDLPRYEVPVGPNNESDEEEDWETESDDSEDNETYYSSNDE